MKNVICIILSYIIFFINSNLLSNEDKILKVGLLAPLTGEHAELGKSLLYSLQLALNEINDEKLFIVPRDAGFNEKEKIQLTLSRPEYHSEKIVVTGEEGDEINQKVLKNGWSYSKLL